MNVIYSDSAKKWVEGHDLLQGATHRLEQVVGKYSPRLRAEWDRVVDDKGQPLCNLKIAVWNDSATTSFSANDLRSTYDLETRLRRLWDHLLKTRLDELLEKLNEDEK